MTTVTASQTTRQLPTVPTITVTTRNRNLSYGWTSRPVRVGNTLDIDQVQCPSGPNSQGSYRQAMRLRTEAVRINSGGNYWRDALFVGGKRVVNAWANGYPIGHDTRDICEAIAEFGFIEVEVAE